MDSSHFFPHFESIFSSKYFILKALKRSFDPNVLNITLLNCACRRNAESFICRRRGHRILVRNRSVFL